jgi:hypothetical protein
MFLICGLAEQMIISISHEEHCKLNDFLKMETMQMRLVPLSEATVLLMPISVLLAFFSSRTCMACHIVHSLSQTSTLSFSQEVEQTFA